MVLRLLRTARKKQSEHKYGMGLKMQLYHAYSCFTLIALEMT